MEEFAACLVTGREADANGVCLEHGQTACVITVRLGPPLQKCVIPGYDCTHDHSIRPVQWQPIEPPAEPPVEPGR